MLGNNNSFKTYFKALKCMRDGVRNMESALYGWCVK